MSGMPGACRLVQDGGIGFDYRLALGLPDYWTTLLETQQDENWQMGDMFYNLTNRRYRESTIAYAESHDQALVGDKTLAFWLMDKEMYTGMSVFTQSMIIDRGIALHKMIRFITLVLGGEGYLNFMGNEFGHPEWIDFPREGNGWSYHYARRQWSLPETDHLKYKYLYAFDKVMLQFAKEAQIMDNSYVGKLNEDNHNKVMIFDKHGYIFVFNFNYNSFEGYEFSVMNEGDYQVILSSDDENLGGFDRVDKEYIYKPDNKKIKIYIPSRTVFVMKKV